MKSFDDIKIPLEPMLKFKIHMETGEPLILTAEEKSELQTALADLKEKKLNRRTPKEVLLVRKSLIKIISLTLENAK